MKYNISFDIGALVLLCLTGLVFFFKKRVPCLRNKVFVILLCVALFSATFDILTVIIPTESIGADLKIWVHVLYYVCHNLLPFLFLIYILFLTDKFFTLSKRFQIAVYLPIVIDLLLIISNPFTKWIMFIDENMVYTRGWLQPICYVVSIYYLIFGVAYALSSRTRISKQVAFSIAGYIGMTLIAVIVQIFNPSLLVESFGSSLCIILVMFTLQNQDDMIEHTTNMLNKNMFVNGCEIKYSFNTNFSIMFIRIPDFELATKVFGRRFSNNLLKSFSDYLYTHIHLGDGYYLEDECFAIVFDKETDKISKIYREFSEKLCSNWRIGSIDTYISPYFLRIDCPADAKDVDVVMDYIEKFKQMEFD